MNVNIKNNKVIFLMVIFLPSFLYAAIDSKTGIESFRKIFSKRPTLQKTMSYVQLPQNESVRMLLRQGNKGFKNLTELAFNKELPTKLRWKSLNRLAKVGREKSFPELERALESNSWFMRNAALVSVKSFDRRKAQSWARLLLNDSALVVRTVAVDTLKDLRDYGSVDLLWNQLENKSNFHKGKSLWIRRKIVEYLATMAPKRDIKRFIGVLDDKDTSLHEPAIKALERLTDSRLGKKLEPSKFKAVYWKKWWSEKSAKL